MGPVNIRWRWRRHCNNVDVGGDIHVRFESSLFRIHEHSGRRGRENETTTTHDDRAEIEPLCLTTFVPNVDDEPLGWNEDVLPTHHARREHGRGHGCGCTAGTHFHGMVDQACPVGMVSARARPRWTPIQFDVVDDGRCFPSYYLIIVARVAPVPNSRFLTS